MKHQIYAIILIMISVKSLCSCGAGIGDTAEKLSGGYTYRTDGSMRYLLSHSFQKQIYPNIVEHVYNENYIIVAQIPSKELHMMFYLLKSIHSL